MDSFEKIKEAKQLLDEGILTSDEYQKLKNQLLSSMDNEVQPVVSSTATTVVNATSNYPISEEGATTGMKVLSFLIPLAGLILFIVDKDKKPVAAKDELMWAGIGFGVGIVLYFLSAAMLASTYY